MLYLIQLPKTLEPSKDIAIRQIQTPTSYCQVMYQVRQNSRAPQTEMQSTMLLRKLPFPLSRSQAFRGHDIQIDYEVGAGNSFRA